MAVGVAVGRDAFGESVSVNASLLPSALEVDSVRVYRFADMDGTPIQVRHHGLLRVYERPSSEPQSHHAPPPSPIGDALVHDQLLARDVMPRKHELMVGLMWPRVSLCWFSPPRRRRPRGTYRKAT